MKTTIHDLLKLIKEKKYDQIGQQELITGKGFHISYAVAGSGPTGDETALVKHLKGKDKYKFYILNGDWRTQYRPLVKLGYKACKELFDANKVTHLNFWSN